MYWCHRADLVNGLQTLGRRRRVVIDQVEAVVEGELNNPLTYLGVVGETGHPGLERKSGSVSTSPHLRRKRRSTAFGMKCWRHRHWSTRSRLRSNSNREVAGDGIMPRPSLLAELAARSHRSPAQAEGRCLVEQPPCGSRVVRSQGECDLGDHPRLFRSERLPDRHGVLHQLRVDGALLVQRHIDIAWNSPLAWLDAVRQALGGACRAIAMRDTDRDRVSHIITKTQRLIATIEDLRGKTVAVGAKYSPGDPDSAPVAAAPRAGAWTRFPGAAFRHAGGQTR